MKVNRTLPKVSPPTSVPTFSPQPTVDEIFRARVFDEPLVPARVPEPEETGDLARALTSYLAEGQPENTAPVEAFLSSYPGSPWRVSVLTNLGRVYRRTGYYTRALEAWAKAWSAGQDEAEPRVRATTDLALAELIELNARLGRYDDLAGLLDAASKRALTGPAAEKVRHARQGYWLMQNKPEDAFRCGPMAVGRVLDSMGRFGSQEDEAIRGSRSTRQGISLVEVRRFAETLGLTLQAAKRTPGAALLLPAVVHWKSGHYAALVREEQGRYLLQDPTFGDESWVRVGALNDESSGYFLVPSGPLPNGWNRVSDAEAANVWGKGVTGTDDPEETSSNSEQECEPCNENNPGMAGYSIHSMLVSLRLTDTPVGYSPPRGPDMHFTVAYNQREAFQPQLFTFSNIGPRWSFNWVSYLEDDPANGSASVYAHPSGGGRETYSGYSAATQSYSPHRRSRAVVARTSTSPIRYERQLPNGSVEVFRQADGAATFPRKIFMTSRVDPQGNAVTYTYDASVRLVAVTDAIGQVTTLSYDLAGDPLKVTKVTDPFGRFATLEYDAAQRLATITDVIGMQSTFGYGTGDSIVSLTTPYGTTQFETGENGRQRWIEVTDPLGGKERVEFRPGAPGMTATVPAATVPAGVPTFNSFMDHRNTFYWDKRAMLLKSGDYTAAKIIHWLHKFGDINMTSGIKESEKMPLENRVWYSYPNQTTAPHTEGSHAQPSAIARVLDDGTTQVSRFEYNERGAVTRETDPRGRETIFEYAANGIDLLAKKLKNGSSYVAMDSKTHNGAHQPLTVTDVAGQVTTYTYNANGTLATMVTPARGGLSLADRTTTYAYFPDNAATGAGRPQTVTSPLGLATSFTYDAYGRVRTITSSDSNTVTQDYDNLDRLTKVTFGDGTYEERVYNRLDTEKHRDREGQWTHYFYDALRRVVSMRDPLGRLTTQTWCTCGSLDKITDANGNTTTWQRDVQGRRTAEIRANTTQWLYTYENTTSRTKQITDPKGQVRNFEYFADDRLKQVSYTNAGYATPAVSFTYDAAFPRLASMTDGTGTTTYSYNAIGAPPSLGAGMLSSVDGPGASDTVTYSYDEMGRRVGRTIDSTTTTWAFDAIGRVTTVTHPVGTFTYGYAGVSGRRATLSYPNGTSTTYAYLASPSDRRVEEIHHKFSGGATLTKFNYSYSSDGDWQTWRQQDESNPARIYDLAQDAAGQLLSAVYRTTDPTPTILKRYGYTYDPAGNRTTDQVDDAPLQGTFNNMNRLLSQQPAGALRFAGSTNEPATVTVQAAPATTTSDNKFSGSANVGSGTSTVTVTATDPANNVRTNNYQVSVSGSSKSFTYDGDGNLTQKVDGDTWDYEWYADNRLAKVKKNTVEVARYIYDGYGRRYQRIAAGVTTTYTYDLEDILREEVSGGSTYRYVHGPGTDEPLARRDQAGAAVFYHSDHLGSVVKVTKGSGAVVTTRRFDPYGNLEVGASEAGYAFTGREWDPDTNLYFYRERWYDAKVGRFISEDPLGIIDGPNRYVYVGSDPIGRTDPSGTTWGDVVTCVKNPFTCTATGTCYLGAEILEYVLNNGGNSNNDRNNAIKHCQWACCIAKNVSFRQALKATEAHESDEQFTQPCQSEMDQWNNRVGAMIGSRMGPNDNDCNKRCDESPILQCEPRQVPPIACQQGGGAF